MAQVLGELLSAMEIEPNFSNLLNGVIYLPHTHIPEKTLFLGPTKVWKRKKKKKL